MFFARGIGWGQKWWQTLLNFFFACSQWEGPSMHSWCLDSFPFKFWGVIRGGRDFFSFFPGSQCVPTMFPLSSQWVPTCSQYVPQIRNVFLNMFSIAPHFYPICFGTCSPPFTYIGGSQGRNYIFQNTMFCLGESPSFLYFWVMSQSSWHNQVGMLAKKKRTWEAPHLINRRGVHVHKFISLPLA